MDLKIEGNFKDSGTEEEYSGTGTILPPIKNN